MTKKLKIGNLYRITLWKETWKRVIYYVINVVNIAKPDYERFYIDSLKEHIYFIPLCVVKNVKIGNSTLPDLYRVLINDKVFHIRALTLRCFHGLQEVDPENKVADKVDNVVEV